MVYYNTYKTFLQFLVLLLLDQGLVHRLDKDTTGLNALGKTERALTELSEQFFERTVEEDITL